MSCRHILTACLAAANLAVGLLYAERRGLFDAPQPNVVHVVDLGAYAEYARSEPQTCLAEYGNRHVLIGGTIIDIGRVDYELGEKWYVRLGTSGVGPSLTTLEFDGDRRGNLKRLKSGDAIAVIGRVASLQMIDRCQVVG